MENIKTKIDFNNISVEMTDGDSLDWIFEVTPSEYIRYAKIDLRGKSKRELINSIGNSKRAIDCQIDKLFLAIGYNPKKFNNVFSDITNFYCTKKKESDLSIKLKVIVAFGFAPCGLVSKIRNLRNKIEHDFVAPDYEEAEEALEIAELFVLATERKLSDCWSFWLFCRETGERLNFHKNISREYGNNNSLISFDVSHEHSDSMESKEYKIKPGDTYYNAVVRMSMSLYDLESFKDSLCFFCSQVGFDFDIERADIEYG